MIIAIGFKFDNAREVQFGKWVNEIVKEYTTKGFTIDDEWLKNGGSILTEKYFDALLARVRNIRSSEISFYQKITDIYFSCSVDYDKNLEIMKEFSERNIMQMISFYE